MGNNPTGPVRSVWGLHRSLSIVPPGSPRVRVLSSVHRQSPVRGPSSPYSRGPEDRTPTPDTTCKA